MDHLQEHQVKTVGDVSMNAGYLDRPKKATAQKRPASAEELCNNKNRLNSFAVSIFWL